MAGIVKFLLAGFSYVGLMILFFETGLWYISVGMFAVIAIYTLYIWVSSIVRAIKKRLDRN